MNDAWNVDLVYKVIIAVAALAAYVTFYRRTTRLAVMLKQALAWIAIVAVIAIAYTLRDDALALGERVLAEFLPSRGTEIGPRSIVYKAANDGHFHVDAVADGVGIKLIVDTGASVVSLTRRDAARIGIDMNGLSFTQRMQTANGLAWAAPVTLRELRVGPIVMNDVRAAVNDGQSGESLLGVSFLARLQSYTVSGSTLTLTGSP